MALFFIILFVIVFMSFLDLLLWEKKNGWGLSGGYILGMLLALIFICFFIYVGIKTSFFSFYIIHHCK